VALKFRRHLLEQSTPKMKHGLPIRLPNTRHSGWIGIAQGREAIEPLEEVMILGVEAEMHSLRFKFSDESFKIVVRRKLSLLVQQDRFEHKFESQVREVPGVIEGAVIVAKQNLRAYQSVCCCMSQLVFGVSIRTVELSGHWA